MLSSFLSLLSLHQPLQVGVSRWLDVGSSTAGAKLHRRWTRVLRVGDLDLVEEKRVACESTCPSGWLVVLLYIVLKVGWAQRLSLTHSSACPSCGLGPRNGVPIGESASRSPDRVIHS